MAFNVKAAVEVNSSGADTNGGGFDIGATFATDLAATVANTSAPVVTAASYTGGFVAGDVGAFLYIASGTNWIPGFYQIASVAGGAATLSAACATVASPTAGTWGLDYSRSTSPRISYVDMAIDPTTNTQFTSSTNAVLPNIVGNYIKVASGTGFTVQVVEVVSVSGGKATCDKSLGTLSSTGGHGALGGALATINAGFALIIGSNHLWIKSGNYTTATTISTSVSGNDTLTTGPTMISGYKTVRGDIGYGPLGLNASSRPVVTATASSLNVIQTSGQFTIIENLVVDSVGVTFSANTCITATGAYTKVRNCLLKNGSNAGVALGGQFQALEYSEILGMVGSNPAINVTQVSTIVYGCSVHDNAGDGFHSTNTGDIILNSLFANNAGVGINLGTFGVGHFIIGNTIVGSGSHGIGNPSLVFGQLVIRDNIIADNGGWGILAVSSGSVPDDPMWDGNLYYNNTSGAIGNLVSGALNAVPYTHVYDVNPASADPVTSHTSGTANFPTDNFGPVTTAGPKAATWLSAFPGNTATANYRDMGAVQHQDAGSGGSPGRPFFVRGSVMPT